MAKPRTTDSVDRDHVRHVLQEVSWASTRWASQVPLTDAECRRWSELWESPDVAGVHFETGISVFQVLVTQLVDDRHGETVQRWRSR